MSLSALFTITLPLIIGLILMFFSNAFLVEFISAYFRRKKYIAAVILSSFLLILNVTFLISAGKKLSKNIAIPCAAVAPPLQSALPPLQLESILKNHQIEKNEEKGTICAADMDEDKFRICLQRENPRDIFPEAFSVVMDKEGKDFPDDKSKLAYARLMINTYYGGSEPFYPQSAQDLVNLLKNRQDPAKKQLGEEMENSLNKGNRSQEVPYLAAPQGYEWDTVGKALYFSDSESKNVLRRISAPKFESDWEGASIFRLYTFSLRYNELIEWHFGILTNGEAKVKKMNVVRLAPQN